MPTRVVRARDTVGAHHLMSSRASLRARGLIDATRRIRRLAAPGPPPQSASYVRAVPGLSERRTARPQWDREARPGLTPDLPAMEIRR
jgi:hypothetical protein